MAEGRIGGREGKRKQKEEDTREQVNWERKRGVKGVDRRSRQGWQKRAKE